MGPVALTCVCVFESGLSTPIRVSLIVAPDSKICGMLYSLNCFVDPISSGLIGILPDSTAGLFRFKCVLTLVIVSVMVNALKPD